MSTFKIEDIGDAVEVVVWFKAGRIMPLRFRWRGRTYKVREVTGDWQSEIGNTQFHHYAVQSDSPDVFELSYNEHAYTWKLEKVAISG
jgi:hypothetical protein